MVERASPQGFKRYLLGKGFWAGNDEFPSPTDVGSHNLLPLGVLASSLAHHLMTGFDTICDRLSLPLANIVIFWLYLPSYPSKF